MTTTTTVRSWSAIVVGVFFTAVTCYVLLEDVARHGAPLSTKHIMTLAVLAGTIYFGHRWWTELAAWRIGTMLGCAVLFAAGTATCVLMSAGRNAEVVTTKALAANSVNTARASAQKDRDEAKLRYQAALQAEEYQCSTGNGPKCAANRITRMVRREEYDAAEATLREQRPEQIANADVVAAAKLVARLPFVTSDAGAIEALLLLVQPFLLSLFCEVGAIVGFSIGLGHGRRCVAESISSPESPERVAGKLSGKDFQAANIAGNADRAERDVEAVFAVLRRLGRSATNAELAALMAVSPGEACKRVKACGDAIVKARDGRAVAISLPQRLH
jgi:hypothetical protein